MARTPRWIQTGEGHGVWKLRLSSWKYFYDYIRQEMLDYRTYVWRGQRCSDWLLESTLERRIGKYSQKRHEQITQNHSDNFMYAARGRRGPNPPTINKKDDWWALGQHYGLATPLLDWTTSPFAAAYFAFARIGKPQTQQRVIFALSRALQDARCYQNADIPYSDRHSQAIQFIRPLSDENTRLVNQGGLFTRCPPSVHIEEWVRDNYEDKTKYIMLLKIEVPNKDRILCLRSLNRMNINHLTLFPDLYGTSEFANMDLSIDKY